MGQIQSAITGAIGSVAMSGIAKRANLTPDELNLKRDKELRDIQKKYGLDYRSMHMKKKELHGKGYESWLGNQRLLMENSKEYKKWKNTWYSGKSREDANQKALGKQLEQEQQKAEFANRKESLSPDILKTIAIMKGIDYINPKDEEDKK